MPRDLLAKYTTSSKCKGKGGAVQWCRSVHRSFNTECFCHGGVGFMLDMDIAQIRNIAKHCLTSKQMEFVVESDLTH